jgi:ABC-type nitrate/sulfonate/bicarbonate transport system substrate-binding protein
MKLRRSRVLQSLGLFVCLAIVSACGSAGSNANVAHSGDQLKTVNVVVTTLSAPDVFAALFVGESYGIFAKHGILLNLTAVSGNTITPLLSGRADVAFPSLDLLGATAATGSPPAVRMFYALNHYGALAGYVVVSPKKAAQVSSIQDLAGMSVAGLAPGTTLWNLGTYYQRVFGVSYNLTALEDVPSTMAALQSGRVDAAILTDSLAATANGFGGKTILDPSSPGVEDRLWPQQIPYVGAVASAQWLSKNAGLAAAFSAALKEATQTITSTDASDLAKRTYRSLGGAGQQLDGFTVAALTAAFNAAKSAAIQGGRIDAASWNGAIAYLLRTKVITSSSQLPFAKYVDTAWMG